MAHSNSDGYGQGMVTCQLKVSTGVVEKTDDLLLDDVTIGPKRTMPMGKWKPHVAWQGKYGAMILLMTLIFSVKAFATDAAAIDGSMAKPCSGTSPFSRRASFGEQKRAGERPMEFGATSISISKNREKDACLFIEDAGLWT